MHDPVYHAEGNVWIHTQNVVDEMVKHQTFIEADEPQKQILLFAAFLHDIAKPQTTIEMWDETEKRLLISQPRYAKAGAKQALDLLWHAGAEWSMIEHVYWLITWHQKPFYIWKATNMMKQAIEFLLIGKWSLLLALVEVDNKGRISSGVEEIAVNMTLLREWLSEKMLLSTAYPFANDESRFVCFKKNLNLY